MGQGDQETVMPSWHHELYVAFATPDLKLLEEALRHTEFLSDISRQNAPNHNDKYDPLAILPSIHLLSAVTCLGTRVIYTTSCIHGTLYNPKPT